MVTMKVDIEDINYLTDYSVNCPCGMNHLHLVRSKKDGLMYYACYDCLKIIKIKKGELYYNNKLV